MKKKKERTALPPELEVSEEENAMRILFDFTYWLENLPGKTGCNGATSLLRMFLSQREDE